MFIDRALQFLALKCYFVVILECWKNAYDLSLNKFSTQKTAPNPKIKF